MFDLLLLSKSKTKRAVRRLFRELSEIEDESGKVEIDLSCLIDDILEIVGLEDIEQKLYVRDNLSQSPERDCDDPRRVKLADDSIRFHTELGRDIVDEYSSTLENLEQKIHDKLWILRGLSMQEREIEQSKKQ